jgi:predicted nucleic acid-binding protein
MINPRDQWHARANEVGGALGQVRLVTTDDVLTEVMNFFAGYGSRLRSNAASTVRSILDNANIETIFIERGGFFSGFELYESRPDKGYSLTDCISMNTMREHGVSELLTHDRHFAQEGFTVLL